MACRAKNSELVRGADIKRKVGLATPYSPAPDFMNMARDHLIRTII